MYLTHQGGARKKKKNREKNYLQSENNYRRIVIIHIAKAIELLSAEWMPFELYKGGSTGSVWISD